MATKKRKSKGPRRRSIGGVRRKPLTFESLHDKVNALRNDSGIDEADIGVEDDLDVVLNDLDQFEGETDVTGALKDAGNGLHGYLRNLKEQMTATEALIDLLASDEAKDVILSEWREGMVSCPDCGKHFRAEDNPA